MSDTATASPDDTIFEPRLEGNSEDNNVTPNYTEQGQRVLLPARDWRLCLLCQLRRPVRPVCQHGYQPRQRGPGGAGNQLEQPVAVAGG